MRALADTHTLVWALTEPDKLGRHARRALDGGVVASVAILWELCIKARRPGALLEDPVSWWKEMVSGMGIPVLGIGEDHVFALASLEAIHKDPFDRIMVAQAMVEKLPLVTRDGHLSQYGIETIW